MVRNRRFVWMTLVLLLVGAGLLIVRLAPWWHSGTTPVELVFYAPGDSDIRLHWDEDEPPLRMVPVGESADGWNWFWGTELPPRPTYRLAVEFGSAIERADFAELKVWRLSPRKDVFAQVSAVNDRDAWRSEGVSVIGEQADRLNLAIAPGARIDFSRAIDRRPENHLKTLLLPIANLLLLALLGVGLFGSGWCFPAELGVKPVRWGRAQVIGGVLVFVIAAAVHWHLVTSAVPRFWLTDSTSYMDKGLALAFEQQFDTGGHEYELNRTPGYPLLIAVALRLFGPSLNGVVQLQTVVALISFAYLFRQLHRLLRPALLILAMPVVLWSPPLIWASHLIATESLFVSCWVVATAAAIGFWNAPGSRFRWAHWLVFALAATWATWVRANGVLLLVLPGCALIGWLVRGYLARPGLLRMAPPPWREVGLLLLPFVLVVLVMGGWAWRNAENRGYPRPTDLAPVVAANAPFNAGMLDVRVFEDPDEYAWVVSERRARGYFFPGWALRNHRFRELTNQWQEIDQTTVGKLADSLKEFVADNNALIPWEARLVAWWRVLGWGLWIPEFALFTQDGLQSDYRLSESYEEWFAQTVEQRFGWLSRNRGDGVSYPRLTYQEGDASLLKDLYNGFVPAYPVVYRFLVIGGIFALAWAAWQRRFLTVVLLAPFFVNLLLNVYFLYVVGRYLQVLDSMLLLGLLTIPGLASGRVDRQLPAWKFRKRLTKAPQS